MHAIENINVPNRVRLRELSIHQVRLQYNIKHSAELSLNFFSIAFIVNDFLF